MSTLNLLFQKLSDPSISGDDACRASDRLAAAVDEVMRGPASLQQKIEAVRIVEARGWDALLNEYLGLLT